MHRRTVVKSLVVAAAAGSALALPRLASAAASQADMVELEQRARAWLAKEGIYTAPKA